MGAMTWNRQQLPQQFEMPLKVYPMQKSRCLIWPSHSYHYQHSLISKRITTTVGYWQILPRCSPFRSAGLWQNNSRTKLAATVGARFLAVSPSCLLRKYVGKTNLNVRALFSVARKISPCAIFVDELDGLFRERGGEDHDVGRELKTEFLQLWDGIRNHAHGGGVGGSSSSRSLSLVPQITPLMLIMHF